MCNFHANTTEAESEKHIKNTTELSNNKITASFFGAENRLHRPIPAVMRDTGIPMILTISI
jgi:hypothetical protein